MTANAVIAGSFADIKSVKSRSVVVLMIEVPIERAADVVAMFGYPQPGEEVPVAVARLMPEAAAPEPEKPKRGWDDMSHSQQAGILCNEAAFRTFLEVVKRVDIPPLRTMADECAHAVRALCGVKSRVELNDNPDASTKWNRLVGEYRDFQRYGDMR